MTEASPLIIDIAGTTLAEADRRRLAHPLVGGLIGFVALIAGIGALVWQAWSGRESRAAAAA